MRNTLYSIAIGFLFFGLSTFPAWSEPGKPIIAQLYSNSENYDERMVTIYGLVIEAAEAGRVFMLQDVSQMPLKVRRTDNFPAFVGDQVMVQGVFLANGGKPYLQSRKIIHTQVLAGGGCC